MNTTAPDIDKKMLRHFGLLFAGILVALFALLLPWLLERPLPRWPFYIAVPVAALALAWPMGLKPLYQIWMKFGAVMGFINTHIILGLLFFVLVTPMALVMRLLGKDPMARRFDHNLASYRRVHQAQSREHMEKPY
jgi:hypothetical protein